MSRRSARGDAAGGDARRAPHDRVDEDPFPGMTANDAVRKAQNSIGAVRRVVPFSMALYTMELVVEDLSAEHVAFAERMAAEIHSEISENSHVEEERGRIPTDDSETETEEERYSAVQRSAEIDEDDGGTAGDAVIVSVGEAADTTAGEVPDGELGEAEVRANVVHYCPEMYCARCSRISCLILSPSVCLSFFFLCFLLRRTTKRTTRRRTASLTRKYPCASY